MAHNITKYCEKCCRDFRVNVFARHYAACKGPKPPKKIRGIDFDPAWGYKNGTRKGWSKGQTKETNASVAKISNTLKTGYASGEIQLSGCAAIDYPTEKRQTAGSKGGGYRARAGRSKKFWVEDSFGSTVCLQSSHELALSEMLNERGIRWKREGFFKYDGRNYFPDFHLIDSDVYLDVKNDYLIKVDETKIQKVREQNPNLRLYVFTLPNASEMLDQI